MAFYFDQTKEGPDRRRFQRIKVSSSIEYRFFNGDLTNHSLTCDISPGGISFFAENALAAGTHIYFRAKLNNRPQPIYGIAQVRWSRQEPYTTRYKIGLEFTEVGSISRADIRHFIEEHKCPSYHV